MKKAKEVYLKVLENKKNLEYGYLITDADIILAISENTNISFDKAEILFNNFKGEK